MKEKWYKEGMIFPTLRCGDLLILEVKASRNILVRFLNTGYERTTCLQNIQKGFVDDPLAKNICGTGYMGIGHYKSSIGGKKLPSYVAWKGMIERCYGPTRHSYNLYGARGVRIADVWHNYQNYAAWYEINMPVNSTEKLQIDKDILFKGNLIYSPQTCVAVPLYVNYIFKRVAESATPLGTAKSSGSATFQAAIKSNNVYKWLGSYKTQEEAHVQWQKAKVQSLLDVSERYKKESFYNVDVNDAILRLISVIECDIAQGECTTFFFENSC